MGKECFAQRNGDGSRGRVDETKAAADELAEVDAVAKGGDGRGLGEGFGGAGDAEIGSDESAMRRRTPRSPGPEDDEAARVARQPRRGVTETGGGGGAELERKENPTKNGAKAGRRGSFDFFYLYALRARGRKRGQCRPRQRGAASPWFTGAGAAQKPADGESEPNY